MEKLKKGLKRVGIGILVLICAALLTLTVIHVVVRVSVKKRVITLEEARNLENVDCILVLGAAVRAGGVPSPILKDRLDKGIELYKAGVAPKLLMSGTHMDRYYDEVTAMKNYAIAAGVPSEDIFLDHAGFSTYDSFYRVKNIYGAKRVVVVTQEYHLYRSLYDAKRQGLDYYGVAADEMHYKWQFNREAREFLASGKDFLQCLVGARSKVTGDPISLEGNGDLTN